MDGSLSETQLRRQRHMSNLRSKTWCSLFRLKITWCEYSQERHSYREYTEHQRWSLPTWGAALVCNHRSFHLWAALLALWWPTSPSVPEESSSTKPPPPTLGKPISPERNTKYTEVSILASKCNKLRDQKQKEKNYLTRINTFIFSFLMILEFYFGLQSPVFHFTFYCWLLFTVSTMWRDQAFKWNINGRTILFSENHCLDWRRAKNWNQLNISMLAPYMHILILFLKLFVLKGNIEKQFYQFIYLRLSVRIKMTLSTLIEHAAGDFVKNLK